MDADKRTAKKRYVGVVWSVWHGPEQREWYGYHLWDICKMTLQHDFRTLQALDFSWLIDDWRLTPSALLNRMGIWVVLHDVLRCNRHLKSYRRKPSSLQFSKWALKSSALTAICQSVSPFISTGSTRNKVFRSSGKLQRSLIIAGTPINVTNWPCRSWDGSWAFWSESRWMTRHNPIFNSVFENISSEIDRHYDVCIFACDWYVLGMVEKNIGRLFYALHDSCSVRVSEF